MGKKGKGKGKGKKKEPPSPPLTPTPPREPSPSPIPMDPEDFNSKDFHSMLWQINTYLLSKSFNEVFVRFQEPTDLPEIAKNEEEVEVDAFAAMKAAAMAPPPVEPPPFVEVENAPPRRLRYPTVHLGALTKDMRNLLQHYGIFIQHSQQEIRTVTEMMHIIKDRFLGDVELPEEPIEEEIAAAGEEETKEDGEPEPGDEAGFGSRRATKASVEDGEHAEGEGGENPEGEGAEEGEKKTLNGESEKAEGEGEASDADKKTLDSAEDGENPEGETGEEAEQDSGEKTPPPPPKRPADFDSREFLGRLNAIKGMINSNELSEANVSENDCPVEAIQTLLEDIESCMVDVCAYSKYSFKEVEHINSAIKQIKSFAMSKLPLIVTASTPPPTPPPKKKDKKEKKEKKGKKGKKGKAEEPPPPEPPAEDEADNNAEKPEEEVAKVEDPETAVEAEKVEDEAAQDAPPPEAAAEDTPAEQQQLGGPEQEGMAAEAIEIPMMTMNPDEIEDDYFNYDLAVYKVDELLLDPEKMLNFKFERQLESILPLLDRFSEEWSEMHTAIVDMVNLAQEAVRDTEDVHLYNDIQKTIVKVKREVQRQIQVEKDRIAAAERAIQQAKQDELDAIAAAERAVEEARKATLRKLPPDPQPVWKEWPPCVYKIKIDGKLQTACIIRGDPAWFSKEDVIVENVDILQNGVNFKTNEELIGNVIKFISGKLIREKENAEKAMVEEARLQAVAEEEEASEADAAAEGEEGSKAGSIAGSIKEKEGASPPPAQEVEKPKPVDVKRNVSRQSSMAFGHEDEEHEDEIIKFDEPVYIALPHTFSLRAQPAREPVFKAFLEGEWKSLRGINVTFPGFQDEQFFQCEMSLFTQLTVMSRLKHDFLSLGVNGGRAPSTVDSRVVFNAQAGSFEVPENFRLQLQPIESSFVKEIQQTTAEGSMLMTTTSIVSLEFANSTFIKPITMLIPTPPNPVTIAKQIALEQAQKESRAKDKKQQKDSADRERANAAKRWYMGQYGANEEDESEKLYLVRKQKNGTWIVDNTYDIQQPKPDGFKFQIKKPINRRKFCILRTKPAMSAKEAASIVQQMDFKLAQRPICSVMRQSVEDPQACWIEVANPSRTDKLIHEMDLNNYTNGPPISKTFRIYEGDLIDVTFRGNMQALEPNEHLTLVYNTQRRIFKRLDVIEQNRFLQRSYELFRGFIQLWRRYKVEIPPLIAPKVRKGEKPKKIPKVYEWRREFISEHIINVSKEVKPGKVYLERTPVSMPGYNDFLTEEFLYDLAPQIKDKQECQRLAALLKIKPSRYQSIILHSCDQKLSLIYEVLLTWAKTTKLSINKVEILRKAMQLLGRPDIVRELDQVADGYNALLGERIQHRKERILEAAAAKGIKIGGDTEEPEAEEEEEEAA